MPLYEHIFLARQDVTSQQVEAMVDQYKGVIEQNGGKVDKTEMWGVKSLAYRIKKNRKAHFTLFNLDAPAPAVAEMERQMRINEDILRFMTIRVEELETEPSVMMQKRDRDERKDRERRERDGGGFDGRRRRGGLIMAFGALVAPLAAAVVRSSVVARPARSRARTRRRSTTRTRSSCRATSPSAARSFRPASRRSRPRSSASSPRRSSAPASSACCPT